MVKKRSFWVGIGLGLVIGSVLLQMMTIGARSESPTSQMSDLTDREVLRSYAERLGYELLPKETNYITEEEHEELLTAAVTEAVEFVEPIEINHKSIYVLPGMSTAQVADVLIALSVITDKEQFIEEFQARNLTANIRTGVKRFPENLSLDEVIEVLISK